MAYKTVKFGDHRERRSFSTKRSTLELSNLLEVQKDSFDLFLKEGIKEVFEDIYGPEPTDRLDRLILDHDLTDY